MHIQALRESHKKEIDALKRELENQKRELQLADREKIRLNSELEGLQVNIHVHVCEYWYV
jgi:hypothetical protein